MYSGIVFNVFNSILFVAISYFIHFFLGRTATPIEYGVIGTIVTILDFEYLFLSNGTRQAVSNELSKQKYAIKDLLVKAFGFQFVLIAIMFAINFIGSPLFASVLSDESLQFYLKVAAFIIPFNGIYVIFVGINEGIHCFKHGALTVIAYSVAKLSIIFWVLWGVPDVVLGAELGYLTSNIVAFVIGGLFVYANRRKLSYEETEKIKFSRYVKNALSFSLFFIIVSVVLSVDVLIVKALLADQAMAGFYTGALNFGKVSYFVLSAFFGVLIPVVTRQYVKGQVEETKNTVHMVINIVVSFILPIAIILSASAKILLRVFYSAEYVVAEYALMILALSHFCMGVVVILNMMISATGEKRFSTLLSICVFVIDILLCIFLTKHYGITGTALAGFLCTLVALVASFFCAKNIFGSVLNKQTVKIVILNVLLWLMVRVSFSLVSIGNIFILGVAYFLLYCLVVGCLHILKLIDLKEIKAKLLRK